MKLYTMCQVRKEQRANVPLPEEFAFQLPSDGRGCFRVAFSPFTSRFLACAVELKDETFEIRIFDLAKSQVHCVLHGHRELIYDMHWVSLPVGDGSDQNTGALGSSDPIQDKLDAIKASVRQSNSMAGSKLYGDDNSSQEQPMNATEQLLQADFPCCLVTASSDGTSMVFEIPEDRNWKTPIYPSQTLYHPSYVYAARSYLLRGPAAATTFFIVSGGYHFGLRVWRIDRKNSNEVTNGAAGAGGGGGSSAFDDPFGNSGAAYGSEKVSGDWAISNSKLAQEQTVEDGSHVTAIRFASGFKKDLFYTSHSSGCITMWNCFADPTGQTDLRIQQVKAFRVPDLAGVFFYNFEIITDELSAGRAINGATLGGAEEWILLNSKDNLVRICGLQHSAIRVHMEISSCINSKFPIRSCISPDGKVIAAGCETGKLYIFSVATGKHLETWEATVNVQLSSPIADVAWSRTHHFLAFCAFGTEETPILVSVFVGLRIN